jgi:twitching motility protein PilI
MANKQALRDLQARLADRLQQVRTESPGQSWLAVECAGQGLLLPLAQAGEIFDLGPVLPVPHTRPWLTGVVNLRGAVVAVIDLAQFLGLRDAQVAASRDQARLVAFNARQGVNGAVLIDRLLGLRHAADMQAEVDSADNAARPAFAGGRFRDNSGRPWQEISLAALAVAPEFLAIAA